MIGHKYTPTVGHTGSYAFGDYVRRNLGATVVELGIPPALAVGSVNVRYDYNNFLLKSLKKLLQILSNIFGWLFAVPRLRVSIRLIISFPLAMS